MENYMLKNPEDEKRTWQWPPRNNILSAIMAPRKNQPPRSLRPRTKKTVYEKCRSRGSQIGFKSLPFWMLQVFSTIAIYMASFFNLLPQWVSLHSTSALSKSNRWEKPVSKQWAGKPVSFFPFLSTNKEVLAASTDRLCSFTLVASVLLVWPT